MREQRKKEKDLEIAARIGQSLLELNRELKTRNDFLEESLNASNETIVQLRHELQLRTNLLHAYVENEDEVDAHSKESVDGLQWKVKKLETENENLRAEALHLKKISSGLEETERFHISECSKNLDLANEKITQLKALLSEKGAECAAQNAEVEKLLKIVAAQGTREKTLITENADLHEQIDETMMIYDELSKDYADLQEKYTEVLSMLHDAEEELKSVRKNISGNRSGSVDSLYDSLASELETSDSGLCSGINSSREICKTYDTPKKLTSLQLELENACLKEEAEKDHAFEFDLAVSSLEKLGNDHDDKFCEFPPRTPKSLLLCCSSDTQPSTSKLVNFRGTSSAVVQEVRCLCNRENSNADSTHRNADDGLLKSGSNDSLESYEGPKFGEPGKPGTRDLDYSLRKRGIRKEIEAEYARFKLLRGLSPLSSPFFILPSPKKLVNIGLCEAGRMESNSNVFSTTRMELLTKWWCTTSKSLLDPLDANAYERAVLSRAKLKDLHSLGTNMGPLRKDSIPFSTKDKKLIESPSEMLKELGICKISKAFLPRYDRFSSHCLSHSESSSLVDSLSSCDFPLKQFNSGIITRMRPST